MFLELCGWKGFIDRGLAPRELQCVLAIASGKTVKEVAKTLGVSPSTTAKRIASAMYKLGVHRQAAMVAEAMKRQIISPAAATLALLMAVHGMFDDGQLLRIRRSGNGGERKVELRVAARRVEQFAVA